MVNCLPKAEEEFKVLSDDFCGDFFNSEDFSLLDIDVDDDTTNGEEVGDWYAKFQDLDPPPMDMLTSFPSDFTSAKFQHLDPPPMDMLTGFPSDFTSASGVNKLDRVGTVPGLNQSGAGGALSGTNTTLHQASSPHDIKLPKMFQSLRPLSVLESSDRSFSPHNPKPQRLITSPVKGMRSKRKRPTAPRFKHLHQLEPSKPDHKLTPGETGHKTSSQVARKCTHCETTETPQWREGPNGPKTLCNACGVRFKSGRLVPEYRPASSPTFIPSVHSNSHRKIIEMRRKEGGQFHTSMIHGVMISRA